MSAHTRPVALLAVSLLALSVAACAAPAAQVTSPPAATETEAPTPEPESDGPSALATESEEAPPSEDADGDEGELDMSLPSNFGSTDLTAGFSPDPFSVELVSGGPIDAAYLGDDCRGFATAASDYDVTYESGNQDLLRFYFVADTEDTTLIVNAPDGSWHCNDDAPGTIDPQIDFDAPESGRYDIWIGSYESGTEATGTLYVTELESNSP